MDIQENQAAVIAAIKNFFEVDDWKYELNEEKGFFQTGVRLKSKVGSVKLYIIVNKTGFSITSELSMRADESCRQNVAEFLTRANYGLRCGNFEMDMDSGAVHYKVFSPTIDGAPSVDAMKYLVYIGLNTVERYGDELLAVFFGMKTPKDAITAAEQKQNN